MLVNKKVVLAKTHHNIRDQTLFFTTLLVSTFAFVIGLCAGSSNSYYKTTPQFHSYPDPKAARTNLPRLGPVGIGLELRQPAFQMIISNVEENSPAFVTGKLKKGQYIESINGKKLEIIDPRIILGNIITEAEATDGVIKMMVKENAKAKASEVIVKIPVMGSYSKTWPINCKKSDLIVRNFADFLAKVDKHSYGAALFLLSTGEQKDLDVVTRWFKGGKLSTGYPWDVGYNGPAVCEYYLRTGDKSVLPAIQKKAD